MQLKIGVFLNLLHQPVEEAVFGTGTGDNANLSHLFFFFIVCLNFKTGTSCVYLIIGLFYLDRINWILQDIFFIFITFLMKVMKNNPPGAERIMCTSLILSNYTFFRLSILPFYIYTIWAKVDEETDILFHTV